MDPISAASIPLTISGLTEYIKRAGVDTKWLPLIAVILGITLTVILTWHFQGDIITGIFQGIGNAFASMGGYEASRKVGEAFTGKSVTSVAVAVDKTPLIAIPQPAPTPEIVPLDATAPAVEVRGSRETL